MNKTEIFKLLGRILRKFEFLDSEFVLTVCCPVRAGALASHTGVRRFDSRGGDCLLLFTDYKLRSIYKS